MAMETSSLQQSLPQLVQASSWAEVQQLIEDHQELLSDEADAVLGEMIEHIQPEKDAKTATLLIHYRRLLQQYRDVDAAAAFQEWNKLISDIPDEVWALIEELDRLTRITDMPQRAEVCQQVLRLVSRPTNPQLWAALQDALGSSLLQNPQGDRDRDENVEAAIAAYQLALEVRTHQAMPSEWATVTMNLGIAYNNRIRGDRAENLERAIDYYEQALQVMTHQAMPIECAKVTANLANTYSARIRDDRAENLERAIDYYEQALQVMTRQAMPSEWAITITNLGNAYSDRIRGERAENLEQAIACYEQALLIRTRQAMPSEWATVTMNLGIAYWNRIRGERSENLEQAIACYEQALLVRTRQSMPSEWAEVTMNLGSAYWNRIRGERAENLEQAIAYYEQALLVRKRQSMPSEWAEVTMNLGSAYKDRIRGERAENQEQAIVCYKQALQVLTHQAMPTRWAAVTMNLGTVYWNRIRGDRDENLEQAITCYKQALLVRTRQSMPTEWAEVTMNLGNAYKDRISGNHAENLEQAIACYEQALLVRTHQAMPIEWAEVTMNLGTAYLHRIHGNRVENLEQVIECYEQALQVRTRQSMPTEWAEVTMNLGTAYVHRICGERIENLERAIAYYSEALEIYRLDAFPKDHQAAQTSMGYLCFQQGRWAMASTAFAAALNAGEPLYQTAATPEARQSELSNLQGIPARYSYALLKANGLESALCQQAVLAIEENRARWLSESLALRSEKPVGVGDSLWQDFLNFGQQIEALQTESRLPDPTPAKRPFLVLSGLLHTAYVQLAETVAQIRAIAPNFMPQACFAEIQSAFAASDQLTVGIYLLATEAGGLALLVHDGNVTAIPLDELTESTVREWLVSWLGTYQTWQVEHTQQAQLAWLTVVDHVLQQLWSQVMAPVAAVLHQKLDNVSSSTPKVILIPTGLLALLPLHAVWRPDLTSPTGRHYFCDEFTVSYAPSALALHHAQSAAATQPTRQLLAVAEPKPVQADPLPSAQAEIDAIAALFEAPVSLRHEAATHQAIVQALAPADLVHFACHGKNNWANPLESGLCMAGDQLLTVRDLLGMKNAAGRLAVLSACETGIVGTELPDEVIALPSALLQAGFGGVVASLWSVADMSTAMLMARFYAYWQQEGLSPAQALRAAQIWLRDTTNREKGEYFKQFIPALSGSTVANNHLPSAVARTFYNQIMKRSGKERDFAHPYWWAAFYLTGV